MIPSGATPVLSPMRATSGVLLTFGVAGLIGGLVYWRIAGRTAGSWRVAQEATP